MISEAVLQKTLCELQEQLIPALSGFFSDVCLGFGSRQQEGSPHCFRWKAAHWENVSEKK